MTSGTPGWYQEKKRPPGHLRYWDGRRWTDYRIVAPPGTTTAAQVARSGAVPWMLRHKVRTAVVVVLLLVFAGSFVPDQGPADPTSASVAPDDGSTRSAEPTDEPAANADDAKKNETSNPRRRGGDGQRRDKAAGAGEASGGAGSTPRTPRRPTFYVSRVIDGDTIELGNGEAVRVVGIDTPEVGECGFEAASAAMSRLVLGKRVQLTISDEDRDGYGRLLRYVDVGETDAGLQLIRNGRAIAAYDSRDGYGFHPRERRYIASDRGSRNLCPMATGDQAPSAPVAPKPQPLVGGGGGANCAAGYSPCVPAGPDLDCPDVNGPIRVTGADPHGLDADGDGVACES
jgi:endonuclease YncB( thermonuclease family)